MVSLLLSVYFLSIIVMPCSDLLALSAYFLNTFLFNLMTAYVASFMTCAFLQSAKMFNYGTDWRRTRDTLFIAFAAVFLLTRLVIFPSK